MVMVNFVSELTCQFCSESSRHMYWMGLMLGNENALYVDVQF